jgi:hypothetical protein
MMADRAQALQKISDQLSKMAAPKDRLLSITEDTEIYRDLGIYGDEIIELVWWLEREFGIKPSMNPSIYAPRELPLFRVLNALKSHGNKSAIPKL